MPSTLLPVRGVRPVNEAFDVNSLPLVTRPALLGWAPRMLRLMVVLRLLGLGLSLSLPRCLELRGLPYRRQLVSWCL